MPCFSFSLYIIQSLCIYLFSLQNIRGGLIQSWQFVSDETLVSIPRPEWPAVLHNLCFFHCASRLRSMYGISAGWNCPYTMRYGCTELMVCTIPRTNMYILKTNNQAKNIYWLFYICILKVILTLRGD